MREIKFQGIYKLTGEQFPVTKIDTENKLVWGRFDSKNDYCHYSTDPNESYGDAWLREFTGFHDVDGREIYSGAIVKRQSDNLWQMKDGSLKMCTWKVEWKYDGWKFESTPVSPGISYPSFYSNAKYMEVIGNVYDNPEFLIERPKATGTTE